jgi:uncharacterized protein (DUF305 family)
MRNNILLPLTVLVLTLALLSGCNPASIGNQSGESGSMEGMDHSTMEDGSSEMSEMEMGVAELEGLSGDEFEVAFLDLMIPHHQSATEMAEIALERTEGEEIRVAAQAIIDAQEAEITQMTGWLDEWHGQQPSGMDHGMSMGNEVEALRTVPAEEFDVAFLNAMIPHHESAIQMAELVPDRTERPELNALATAIRTTQQVEIDQFSAWLEAWGAAANE